MGKKQDQTVCTNLTVFPSHKTSRGRSTAAESDTHILLVPKLTHQVGEQRGKCRRVLMLRRRWDALREES